MAEFVKGNQLNSALEEIFENAEKKLIIISPFIKLHARFIDVLKSKIHDDDLKITVVFGKNENNLSKSFNVEDFNFLKDFPNIEIKYEPRLHAKYYANDFNALLSSMNLYDFSQNNNIEFGILTKVAFSLNLMGDTLDIDAQIYFDQVISNSKTLYKKVPVYESKMLGFSQKYVESEIEINEIEEIFNLPVSNKKRKETKPATEMPHIGYCIRTGEKIPFNPERPFSKKAFESWNKFKDKDYKEKYCHFSGESSNGETSFSKPILRKNWNKAKGKI